MRTVLLIAAFLMGGNAKAKDEDLKVAYVDMARALNEVEEGRAAKAKLKSDFDKKQEQLDKMQTELKAKQEEFEKQKQMMKEEIKQTKLDEMQRKFVELQQTYSQLQRELMDEEGKVTAQIAARLRNIIAKIGDRDSYSLILNIGDTVMYHKRHQEITDDVIAEYNRQFPAKK